MRQSGLALRELLLNEKKEHVGLEHTELVFAAVGCILLLSAAISFGLQRVKVATRFGDICGSLLQPDEIHRSTSELLMEPISRWRWWRGYLIGRWLLPLGLVDLILAGIFTLPANIFSNGRRLVHCSLPICNSRGDCTRQKGNPFCTPRVEATLMRFLNAPVPLHHRTGARETPFNALEFCAEDGLCCNRKKRADLIG